MKTNSKKPGKDIFYFILFTILAIIATPILEMLQVRFPTILIVLLAIVYIPFILIVWVRHKNISYILTLAIVSIVGMPLLYRMVWSISSGVTFTILVFTTLFLIINIITIAAFNNIMNSSHNQLLIQQLESGNESVIVEMFDYLKEHTFANRAIFNLSSLDDLESKILANRKSTYDITSVKSLSQTKALMRIKSKSNKEAAILIDKSSETIKVLTLPNASKELANEILSILKKVKMRE